MAEPGDEHRIVDGRRDGVAAAGQQRGGDGAAVAVQHGADARIDRIAQALHEGGVAQRPAAAVGRLRGLDRAHHKTGGADARQNTCRGRNRSRPAAAAPAAAAAAPSTRRNCRPPARCPCAPTAAPARVLSGRAGSPSRRRAAQSGRCARGCRGSRRSPTATPNRSAAPARHARPARSSRSRTAKPAATAAIITAIGNIFCRRSRNAAAQSTTAATGGNRQDRFMIGGEIEGDAGAEGDRHPGQQPAGAGLGADPVPQFLDERRPRGKPDGARPPACAAPRGGQVPAKPCVRSPAPLCHRVRLTITDREQRLPEAAIRPKAERMQNP